MRAVSRPTSPRSATRSRSSRPSSSDGAPALARFVADLDGEEIAEKRLLVRPQPREGRRSGVRVGVPPRTSAAHRLSPAAAAEGVLLPRRARRRVRREARPARGRRRLRPRRPRLLPVVAPDGRRPGARRRGEEDRRRDAAPRIPGEPRAAVGARRARRRRGPSRRRGARDRRARLGGALHEGRRPGEPLGRGGQAPRLGPRLDRHARRPVGGPDPRVRGSRSRADRGRPPRSGRARPRRRLPPLHRPARPRERRGRRGRPAARGAADGRDGARRARGERSGPRLPVPPGRGEGGRRLRRRARRADGARRGAIRFAVRGDVGSGLRRERHAHRLRRLPRRPEPRPSDRRGGPELLGALRPRLPPLGSERLGPGRSGEEARSRRPRRSRGSRGSRRTPARST